MTPISSPGLSKLLLFCEQLGARRLEFHIRAALVLPKPAHLNRAPYLSPLLDRWPPSVSKSALTFFDMDAASCISSIVGDLEEPVRCSVRIRESAEFDKPGHALIRLCDLT
jgi:hypothetical protein